MRDGIITAAITAVLLLFGFLCSCKCPCSTISSETIDTTDINVRTREIPIKIEADSASIKALLRCDSAYNVVLEELATLQGARIKADASVQMQPDGGMTLNINCKEDSLLRIIQAQDSIIKHLRSHKEVERVEVEVEKKGAAFWKGSGIAFWILIGILVIGIAIGLIIKFAK